MAVKNLTSIDRKVLYNYVWSKTLKDISEEYGVKPRVLRLACDTLNIPTPPLGYWAKVANGKGCKMTPLPKLTDETPVSFNFLPHLIKNRDQVPRVTRLQCPSKTHPIIKLNDAYFKEFRTWDRGIVYPSNQAAIGISITKASVRRALKVMNVLLWQFDKNGWVFTSDRKKPISMIVKVNGENVEFTLKEATRRRAHVLTKSELAKKARGEDVWHHRYDYIPSGELTLAIESSCAHRGRNTFKDRKRMLLEDQLGLFLEQLVPVSININDQRLLRAEDDRRRALQREQRYALKKLRDAEIKQRAQLIREAENWGKAQLIRSFVADMKLKRDQEWLLWAVNYADILDPAANGKKSIVEETEDMGLDNLYF